jgi:peptidoglycan/LPS O-acetylase OafA/YrhL
VRTPEPASLVVTAPIKAEEAAGTPARSVGLDLARCLAITLLLLAHVGQTVHSPLGGDAGIRNFYYGSLGNLAVTIFLVISGWVLELRYGGTHLNYRRFLVKRLLRILPVYYLALLVGVLTYIVVASQRTQALRLADIPLSLTGMYAFAGRWGGPFLSTGWFIGLIIVLYMLFPLLSPAIRARPLLALACLLVVSSLSRVIIGHSHVLPNRPLDWFPLCRVFEFSLGIYVGSVFSRRRIGGRVSFGRFDRYIVAGAALSFPLFLVHYPLLFIIPQLTLRGVNVVPACAVFVLVAGVASWVILVIDRRVPRQAITATIDTVLSGNRPEAAGG